MRRRDVVEEPAPLVVEEHEQPALPVRRAHERGEQVLDELLPRAWIAERMVIVSGLAEEARIDERHLGEPAGFGIFEVAG